jgi:hypothetical protein
MCRNIKVLRRAGAAPTQEELQLAALQYVRKVSGFHKPSRVNQPAFDDAVLEISAATGRLLETLAVPARTVEPRVGHDQAVPGGPLARPRARRYPGP